MPPADPKARKLYDHDKEWLSHSPNSFIVTNIRGEGLQYAERRQAALDLVRERTDQTTVPELMSELERKSFLSDQICEILGEWKVRQALPLLKKVENDSKRPKAVREKARWAIKEIGDTSIREEKRFVYPQS